MILLLIKPQLLINNYSMIIPRLLPFVQEQEYVEPFRKHVALFSHGLSMHLVSEISKAYVEKMDTPA